MVSPRIWLSLGILSICAVLLIPYQQLFVCCEVLCGRILSLSAYWGPAVLPQKLHLMFQHFLLASFFMLFFSWRVSEAVFHSLGIWDPLICSVAWCFWPCWWSSSSKPIYLWQAAWACVRIPHASCVASIWGLWILFPPFYSCRMGNTVEMPGCFSLMSIKTENPLTT